MEVDLCKDMASSVFLGSAVWIIYVTLPVDVNIIINSHSRHTQTNLNAYRSPQQRHSIHSHLPANLPNPIDNNPRNPQQQHTLEYRYTSPKRH
jgi:hypothetical protein